MVQGELEMKKGSDGRKCLHYLDRAVELNDYDEAALVARSRSAGCSHLGQMFINAIALGNEGEFLNSQCKTYQFSMNLWFTAGVTITWEKTRKLLMTRWRLVKSSPPQVTAEKVF